MDEFWLLPTRVVEAEIFLYGLHIEDDGALTFRIYPWYADFSDGSFQLQQHQLYDAGGYISKSNAVVAQPA